MAVDRAQVLSLYRQILRFSKKWKVEDKTPSAAEERSAIRTEAQQRFRENKAVSDPVLIESLLKEAQNRLVQAEHYGIPFERPKYLHPNTAFCMCIPLDIVQMSSTRSNPTSRCVPVSETCEWAGGVRTGLAIAGYPHDLLCLIRHVLAGVRLPDGIISSIAQFDSSGALFLDSVFSCSLLVEYPIRSSYLRKVLKEMVEYLESRSMECPCVLFDRLAECLVDGQEWSHRIFLSPSMSSALVIRESNEQLCHGTTGLSLWQASCDLAFHMTHRVPPPKKVLELGAGCGLAGLSVAVSYPDSTVVLTDYDEKVLAQLAHNMELNMGKTGRVRCQSLDWFESSSWTDTFDVVMASDVVYDRRLVEPLCLTIRHLLAPNGLCVISCAVRDAMTLNSFETSVREHGLVITDTWRYMNGRHDPGDKTPFLHSSSLHIPTLIYHIVADKSMN